MTTSDEAALRRARSDKYLRMWGIEADTSPLEPVTVDAVTVRPVDAVHARLLALTLLGLKGQGLAQDEVFAFADAYGVWPGLIGDEHDFVLDPAPLRHDLVQAAWRFDGAWALLWAVGLAGHLAFPDRPVDPARVVAVAVGRVGAVEEPARPGLRPVKELLDGIDVIRRIAAVAAAARRLELALPGGLDAGVVHERVVALDWLLTEGPEPPPDSRGTLF